MALIVKYTLDPSTVTAVLRRTVGGVFDANNITDTVNIEGTVEHAYNDAVIGQSYGFLITAYDAEGKGIDSASFNTIYLGDTGPGKNSVVTRGYFDFGVIEELSVTEFGKHPLELRDELASTVLPSLASGRMSVPIAGWYKCLVEGKVIFIPKNFFLASVIYKITPNDLISQGLISNGPDGTYNFDNNPIITIRGYKYRWRLMKSWAGETPDVGEKIKTIGPIDYTGRTEYDLFSALCGSYRASNHSPGYDSNLSGTIPPVGNQLPPFVCGDIKTSVPYPCIPHNQYWPDQIKTTVNLRYLGTAGVWNVSGFSNGSVIDLPIVLELVE